MNEWAWSNGRMILTGENWSTGTKTLYSVGGKWMNEYGTMVERYWQGKMKYWEKNIIQHHRWMNEWEWCNGGMILTGKNWSTGRKTLYSFHGSWMNEYGAMVEWYWQGKTEVMGQKPYMVCVVDEWMRMEQWWNDIDRGNLKYWKKTLYSVDGRWMTEHGAMVEWYWQRKTEVLGEKHYTVLVVEWYWQGKSVVKGETFVPMALYPTRVSLVNNCSNFILLNLQATPVQPTGRGYGDHPQNIFHTSNSFIAFFETCGIITIFSPQNSLFFILLFSFP